MNSQNPLKMCKQENELVEVLTQDLTSSDFNKYLINNAKYKNVINL